MFFFNHIIFYIFLYFIQFVRFNFFFSNSCQRTSHLKVYQYLSALSLSLSYGENKDVENPEFFRLSINNEHETDGLHTTTSFSLITTYLPENYQLSPLFSEHEAGKERFGKIKCQEVSWYLKVIPPKVKPFGASHCFSFVLHGSCDANWGSSRLVMKISASAFIRASSGTVNQSSHFSVLFFFYSRVHRGTTWQLTHHDHQGKVRK